MAILTRSQYQQIKSVSEVTQDIVRECFSYSPDDGALTPWLAAIYANGKSNHLGVFESKGEAIEARKAANRKYGYHENHGKKRNAAV